MQKKITIIGAGAWGSALAQHLARNSHQVFLQVIDKNQCQEINQLSSNSRYLPNIKLNTAIIATLDWNLDSDFVFIVVPSKNLSEIFIEIAQRNFKKSCCFVICSKGIIATPKLSLISDYFAEITGLKNHVSLLGPNFAIEVANSLPTFTTIASPNKELAKKVIKILNSPTFSAIYFKDQRTAEISGAIKNIMAIGCGMLEGLSLGQNCKAALILKGISEIQLMCKAVGASSDLANPAGFGDIFLTCSSDKSRNYSLGVAIAKGENLLIAKSDNIATYEGAVAAKLVVEFAKSYKINLELCCAVLKLLSQKIPKNQIKSVLIAAIFNPEDQI